jgi:hypothetical protein
MDIIEDLKGIKNLLDAGAITGEEFNALKKKILSKDTGWNKLENSLESSPIAEEKMTGKKVSVTPSINQITSAQTKPENYEEGNETTIKFFRFGVALGVLLSIIFWVRYGSFVVMIISAILSIGAILVVYRKILKVKSRNISLGLLSLLFLLLTVTPIGGNSSSKKSLNLSQYESAVSDGQSEDDKYVRDYIISHKFTDIENGTAFTLEFSDSRGGWFGIMTMKMRDCWFLYRYETTGRTIKLTFDSSNCTTQGSSTTAHFNSDNTISIYYKGEEFVFEPI